MSKTYYMNLNEAPFALIKNKQKTIEMRLNRGERKDIESGDHIVFSHEENGETLKVKVLSVSKFPTFKELYEHFDKKMLGYKEDEEASYLDMNYYYSDEDIAQYGVLGIEIELV